MTTLTLGRGPRQPKPVTRERILKAAKDGSVQKILTEHYGIYYERDWIEKLQLVKDLQEEELLKGAEFDPQLVGDKPAFLTSDPRITTSGLEQLDKINQRKPSRRFAGWLWLAMLSPLLLFILQQIWQTLLRR